MDFLKKLKDSVLEEDAPSSQPVKTMPTLVVGNAIPYLAGMSASPASPILDNATLRSKVSGPGAASDFIAAAKSLSAFIPDEPSLFKAAMGVIAARGLSVSAVSADFGSTLGRLDAECKNFESAKAAKQSNDVTGPAQRLTEIDRKIGELQQERSTVASAVESAKDAIAKKETEFYASANALKAEYQGQLEKIKLYLGANS